MSQTLQATTRLFRMQQSLTEKLNPMVMEFQDQSHRHAHHAETRGSGGAGETHFDLLIVSETFQGKRLLERHRMVNDAVAEEFKSGLHALSIKAKTPSEYDKQ